MCVCARCIVQPHSLIAPNAALHVKLTFSQIVGNAPNPQLECCPLPKGLLNRQGGMRDPGGGHVHTYVYHVRKRRDDDKQ